MENPWKKNKDRWTAGRWWLLAWTLVTALLEHGQMFAYSRLEILGGYLWATLVCSLLASLVLSVTASLFPNPWKYSTDVQESTNYALVLPQAWPSTAAATIKTAGHLRTPGTRSMTNLQASVWAAFAWACVAMPLLLPSLLRNTMQVPATAVQLLVLVPALFFAASKTSHDAWPWTRLWVLACVTAGALLTTVLFLLGSQSSADARWTLAAVAGMLAPLQLVDYARRELAFRQDGATPRLALLRHTQVQLVGCTLLVLGTWIWNERRVHADPRLDVARFLRACAEGGPELGWSVASGLLLSLRFCWESAAVARWLAVDLVVLRSLFRIVLALAPHLQWGTAPWPADLLAGVSLALCCLYVVR